jgi:hypothetical protein
MAKADAIIRSITDLIEARIDAWNSNMPKLQEDAYKVVLELSSELETTNGQIKPSVKNIKTIAKIKAELDKTIFNKEYQDDLDAIIEDYKTISALQRDYFTAVVGKYKVPSVLEQIQQLAQDAVINQLGQDAISANFTGPIQDILVKNVTTGGSRADFIEQAREFMLNTDAGDGRLVRYTKQIVTDSLNQFSANYNATLTDDLGLKWYKYDGSLKDTSRPFCDALIGAKQSCMPYIHVSQLEEIVSGLICGEQVPLNERTGLPAGMIAGTNASNFRINRGGYNCNHQLYPVSAAVVPKELRDKFKNA